MKGRLVQQGDLKACERQAMFRLLSEHFEGVTQLQFQHDLAEKNWVVMVERDETLVGFSTIHHYEARFAHESIDVVYSGDTIVAPSAWGSAAFPRAWIHSVYQLRRPDRRLIWLLLTSGFRTYRFLPVFWRDFYPRFDEPTPPSWQGLLNELAGARFGDRFDPRRGIVSFEHPQRLRPGLADIPPARREDPHVRFFLDHNPGHAAGDELVCITDLSPQNLSPAGRRVVYGAQSLA